MESLTQTESGLIVPTSALPPVEVPPLSSVINPFEVVFPSKETAERFASRCVVRWQYSLSLQNVAKEDEPANWRARARKGNGLVHDTWSPAFVADDCDTKLLPVIDIKKLNDKAYTIVNKA